jgi:hypothetical protein
VQLQKISFPAIEKGLKSIDWWRDPDLNFKLSDVPLFIFVTCFTQTTCSLYIFLYPSDLSELSGALYPLFCSKFQLQKTGQHAG